MTTRPLNDALKPCALALYKPPFKFESGYFFDADGNMVADKHEAEMMRVRGWGRISYKENAEALQDGVGAMIAEAMTEYWNRANTPDSAAQGAMGVDWALFPGWLIDHCEGRIITEEGLQQALSDMLAHEKSVCPKCRQDWLKHDFGVPAPECPDAQLASGIEVHHVGRPSPMPMDAAMSMLKQGLSSARSASKSPVLRGDYEGQTSGGFGVMPSKAQPSDATAQPSAYVPTGYKNETEWLQTQLNSANTCIKAHQQVIARLEEALANTAQGKTDDEEYARFKQWQLAAKKG